MTASSNDERIAAYLELCGPTSRHEGYGFYWMLLEAVASQIESGTEKCSATYPLTTWSRLLYCHHHTVGKYLGKLEVTGLVTVKKGECSIEVIIPNLLKYRDEYNRKSGHSPDNLPTKKQIQIQNTEAEQNPKPHAAAGGLRVTRPRRGKRTTEEIVAALGARLQWWEEFWRVYPEHNGMNEAMNAFERRVHTRELALEIYHAAKRYAERCASDPTAKIKYAQGWINAERWKDPASQARAPTTPAKLSFVEGVMKVVQDRIEKGQPPL